MKSFLDTNFLVYLFDEDSPTKKALAQELFEIEASAGDVVLSTQVLQEFYVTVTRKLARPLKAETALQALSQFAALSVIEIDSAMILGAARRCLKDSISFWDALIVDAALKAGARRLWSEDLQDGRTIDVMRIENPFRNLKNSGIRVTN